MNVFEQYGIKEVTNCTLFAIALDKYDDEIYIPIMYFDSLKVSTMEQTADQTAARGGIGNPELIIWDFNKEITVNIEDALYTPASQSLMWGGLFGIKKHKIFGTWDPYIYEKDRQGRPIYLIKEVITQSEYEELDDKQQKEYIRFVCPCDESIKYMRYIPAKGHYKYASQDSDIDETGRFNGESYAYPYDGIYTPIIEDGIKPKTYSCSYMMSRAARPEKAYIILDNFVDFEHSGIAYAQAEEGYITPVEVELCNKVYGLKNKNCGDLNPDQLDYKWINCDLKMMSMEGDQDIYCMENATVRYRTSIDSIDKNIMISERRLRDKDGQEVNRFIDDELIAENQTYTWEYDPYDSKVDFYTYIKWTVPNEFGKDVNYFTKILVGTFYIVETLNFNSSIEDLIHPLDYGINDVYYLDRTEECVAAHTFAINTDRNLAMWNYSQLPQYEQTELSIFIDPKTMKPYESNTDHFHRRNGDIVKGNLAVIKQNDIYYKQIRRRAPKYTSLGRQIIVDAEHYPGTFRLVGETFARRRDDWKDENYQIDIPLCKLSANTNLTLEAQGDPTTFSMQMKVLRREDGVMVKLTQYSTEKAKFDEHCSNSHEIVPTSLLYLENDCKEKEQPPAPVEKKLTNIELKSPTANTVYCVPGDCQEPYGIGNGKGKTTYLQIQSNEISLDRSKLVIKEIFNNGDERYYNPTATDSYDSDLSIVIEYEEVEN